MRSPSRSTARAILALTLLCASTIMGCGDSPNEPARPADSSPATRKLVPAGQATESGPAAGGASAPAARVSTAPFARPKIEPAEPPLPAPILQLTLELGWDDPYVGEPLPVRVYLSSPRAEAALESARGSRGAQTAAGTRPAEGPLSALGADWPASVRFALHEIKDGQPRAVGVAIDWSTLRVPGSAAVRGNRVAEWEVPASTGLPAGEYLLRVTWDGVQGIDARTREESELAGEVRFAIATPQGDAERSVHAERMALLAYRASKFSEARGLAEDAVKADRQSISPQRIQMLLAQADSCLAMKDFKAGLDVYRSILKLPLDDRLAADLAEKVKVLEKLVAKPKPREVPPRPPK